MCKKSAVFKLCMYKILTCLYHCQNMIDNQQLHSLVEGNKQRNVDDEIKVNLFPDTDDFIN